MRRARVPWPAAAALLLLVLSVLRALHLDAVIGGYTSCPHCFLRPVLGHDAWLVGGLFVLLGIAASLRTRWLALPLRIVAAAGVLMVAADVELLQLFNQHFYLADLAHFSGDPAAALSVARAQFLSPGGFINGAFAVVTLIVIVGLVASGRAQPRLGAALALGGVCLLAAGVWEAREPFRSVHGLWVRNVLEANLPPGRMRTLSPGRVARAEAAVGELPHECTGAAAGAPAAPRSVVLVLVESLSAYQSALLGGPQDWLPRLDKLARANHYFTHFYANGFTTDGGEIALLTGRVPLIPDGSEWYSLSGFGPGPDTLPSVVHRAGGEAYYFTATDLAFLGSGDWLRRLGFDGVEGAESAFYRGMPRSQFGAADDAALFARFEKWLDARTDPRPFVAVLLTVSSHPPFVDPRSGRIDPPGSFGYVDEQLVAFHDRLAQRGFLHDGVLLVTGDHRSMTPMPGPEYRKFGQRAFARIPLVIAGAVDLPRVVDASFQQTDLPASIAGLLGVSYCRTPFTGDFLAAPPAAPRYVVHARGDDRDRVDVYSANSLASYWLDGDDSHWAGALPERPRMVAAWIDAQRVRNRPPPAGAAGH